MSIRNICVCISMILIMIIVKSCSCNDETNEYVVTDSELHASLERIEERVIYFIATNTFDSASLLMPQLVHPSTKYMPGNIRDLIGFDLTYNQYWGMRREKLRGSISNRIDSVNYALKVDTSLVDSSITALDSISKVGVADSLNKQVSRSPTIPDNLLGLYLKQYEEGRSKFYKLVKLNENYHVIYQDNLSDKVNIERYIILSYDSENRTLNLESEVNRDRIVRLKFKQDAKSPNGLMILDVFNNEYGYVQ